MRDYLASVQLDRAKDVLQYGVPGMKWGQRRSNAQLASAAAARGAAAGKAAASSPDKSSGDAKSASAGSETPATRYARLKVQAKDGGASQMSDEDLKFFNSRTEALNKVRKMNETKPGWLNDASKTVLQKATQKAMQDIADTLANKYVSGPIIDNIGKHVPKEVAGKAAKEATKKVKS